METFAFRSQRPWAVWESPSTQAANDKVRMLVAYARVRLASPRLRRFDSTVTPATLKSEIMQLLKPSARIVRPASPRQRIALICDRDHTEELASAYDIDANWNTEFEFDLPHDAVAASATGSDGVLLIWGKAKESWTSDQFQRLAAFPAPKGLCVFDPEKRAVVQQIRGTAGND